MILADKIIEERKRLGWSQEELAEKLDVSRQSVSKWEGAQSIPDINRIILMADLFGVSTDYLLRDDAVRGNEGPSVSSVDENTGSLRRVSMDEAAEFLEIKRKQAPYIAGATSLCVLSPVLLIVLSGLAEGKVIPVSEDFAGGIGVVVLLLMVAAAVYTFITKGSESKKYDFLDREPIDTEYGVDGMAREKRAAFYPSYNKTNAIATVMCILCAVPLLIAAFMEMPDHVITSMIGILLIVVATAVNLFIRVGTIKTSYDRLLQDGDYTINKKEKEPVLGKIGAVYWPLTTAIYLAWSFITDAWNMTWIIWPVSGVLFAAVMAIARIIIKAEE